MKKIKTTDQEHIRKPHRLSLNRETILPLNEPALLELIRGGGTSTQGGGGGGICESDTRHNSCQY